MDIIKIQFKPGTHVIDIETKEILIVNRFGRRVVYFRNMRNSETWDHLHLLGKEYVKICEETAKILYANK